MLALPPKMSIDTLLAAAKYIEENDKQRRSSLPHNNTTINNTNTTTTVTPHQLQHSVAVQQQQQQHQQHQRGTMTVAAHHLHIQAAATVAPTVTPAVVLHQVVQQAPQPFQQVTIKPTNGHIIATAPVNAIRIQKKDVNQVNQRLTVMNSFDLINPAVIDQNSGEVKRKQPPIAFRTGTREVHNKLEKNRRAHLKDCFDDLNAILSSTPTTLTSSSTSSGANSARVESTKKTSNLNILDSALQCIKELEKVADTNAWELERLSNEKISLQQRYSVLRRDIKSLYNVDVPDIPRGEEVNRKRHRHYGKQKASSPLQQQQVKQEETAAQPVKSELEDMKPEPPAPLAAVMPAVTPTTAMVAVAVDHTPLTTACTTIPAVIGGVLSLPTTSISNGAGGASVVANNCITGLAEDVINRNGTVASIVTTTPPQSTATAYTFGIHQLPVTAAANGGLVLQKVLVPKALTAGVAADPVGQHPHHHQLTAQFVSAHHHHHHHLPTVVGTTSGGDSKVIVNAQYVVKPLVVVSTASRPS